MNLSLPPASFYPPGPADYTVNDTILGSAVKLSEWFRNELYRLQNNIQPRHCENYDELVFFIMNPELLDPLKPTPPTLNQFQENDDKDGSHMEQDEDSDHDDDDINEDNDSHTNNNNNNIPTTSEHTTHYQTKRHLPTTLCRVFLEMMRYCSRVSTTTNNNAPRLLLSEFDKLRQDVKAKKAVHAIEFREKLLKILFGKIQMTEYLIKCWKFICEWVTRPPLYNHVHAMKWVEMTLSAFIAARRLFYGECLREQQQLKIINLQK